MALTVYGSPYVDGTDLVANWPAASLTVAQSIDSAGYYIGRGNNTQTGSYTTVLTDAGKVITMSNASANTVTIPANSSVAYVIGTRINILNLGAGACTPTAGAGVTINGTITALATNSSAAVIKTATNTWSYVPFGSGGAATLTSGDVTSTTGSPTITTSGANTIYTFTGSGTIVLGKAGLLESLIIGAGGGASGSNVAQGGGGAGGYLRTSNMFLSAATHTVTVGAGVANGKGAFSRLSSFYIEGGGQAGQSGASGGSGGGAGLTGGVGGAGVSGLGNAGGNGGPVPNNAAGGGGGAGAAGTNAPSTGVGGAGGVGLSDDITGTGVFRGGGGGGGGTSSAGAGGNGGGGAGVVSGTRNNGSANTGGGGGGSGALYVGSTGGSGVVIIRVVT